MPRRRLGRFLRFALLTTAAVSLHTVVGWEWSIAAGAGTGFWFGRRGWLWGALVVSADWAILVAYNYYVDARATSAMAEAIGGILGNMPSFAVVAITLFLGALIGLLGGAAGTQLRLLVDDRKTKTAAA